MQITRVICNPVLRGKELKLLAGQIRQELQHEGHAHQVHDGWNSAARGLTF